MNDYLKSNKAFQLAMETLKSESRYNVGMIEAKEEGIKQGREEGLEEGIQKNQREVVLKMYKKGKYIIRENKKLAEKVYRMVLEGDTQYIQRPGQFINIELDGFYLRRPISVCDYDDKTITIIYKILGKGTEKMSTFQK